PLVPVTPPAAPSPTSAPTTGVPTTGAPMRVASSRPTELTPPPLSPPPFAAVARSTALAPSVGPSRFAIEFGPFVSAADAEIVERRLTEAGYATVRSRQRSGATTYAVLIERVPTTHEAKRLAATLREHGEGDTALVSADPIVLRVGTPLPLRGAVELAERLRARGHQVRVAAQPGETSTFIVRLGAFASRDEAEIRRRELGQLDLPANQIVQVR